MAKKQETAITTAKVESLVPMDKIQELEAISQSCELLTLTEAGRFEKAIRLASGIRALRAALTGDVMKEIMPLQGSSLGFRTDKDRTGGYPMDAVRDCLIEATLRGANPIGNEFNIIAGRSYMTKEFFTRMVGAFPGLSDLRLRPGIPVIQGKSALVPYVVSWMIDGHQHVIRRVKTENDDTRIPVRVNEGQGPDAVIGKATRKILAQVYAELTGSAISFPDGDTEDGVIDVTPQVDTGSVKDRLAALNEAHEAADAVVSDASEDDTTEDTSEDEDAGEGQETADEEEETPEDDDMTDNIPPHTEDGEVIGDDPDAVEIDEDLRKRCTPTKPPKPSNWYTQLVEMGTGVPDDIWFPMVAAELEELGINALDSVPQSLRGTVLDSLKKRLANA